MTFDLDTTTLDIDASTLDGLIQELQNQATLLVTVATGGQRIQVAEAEHQRRRQRLIPALENRNLKYPFPWQNLWLWHGYWSENLPSYASRRTYIHQLVSPVLDALERQQPNLTVVNPQSQESMTVAMPKQRATRAAERQEVVSSTGSNKCAGTTKGGKPCLAKPRASGYCPIHDPALIEKKRLIDELKSQIFQGLTIPIENHIPRDHQALALQRLEHLLERFHRTIEHYGKPNRFNESFHIELQADLQYMLYGMLINNFDDVRPEDFVPCRAGARSRIDFLLQDEKIAIEAKVTRPGMNDRKVGEQLIIDFERYQSAPDCQIVVCYVYDPGRFIQNPRALKRDLEKTERKIQVKVIIYRP